MSIVKLHKFEDRFLCKMPIVSPGFVRTYVRMFFRQKAKAPHLAGLQDCFFACLCVNYLDALSGFCLCFAEQIGGYFAVEMLLSVVIEYDCFCHGCYPLSLLCLYYSMFSGKCQYFFENFLFFFVGVGEVYSPISLSCFLSVISSL